MSKQIEERVVSMQFDNSRFERNVSQSMSTLDKLKQKLNLSGASKGLENVQTAASKVDMHGLANNVETVRARFSALEVMGVTALANITNSAVNAGKRMLSALTIDPVMSGFQEYETQMNAVQTILANTQSKGSTLNDVTAALDELNKYADLTIYNFTEMTRNIGTFTAAGVDLDTSVSAIQGIANLAAVSGSTSQQASTAMYQLSQALAAGTVKLMDWNSVVNAGMGGEVFQNALKETSKLLGTGAEAAIKAKGSFRESLTTGWLTSEVLTETLKKFTTSGANEYVAKYTGLSVDAVEATLKSAEAQYGEADAIDKAADALAKKSGKSKDEIKSALQMAKTAQDAATKVKTFSQLWDVMKEAAQSGWAKTWQLIIGDFEEAKALLTPLADFFTGVIGKMSDARNKLLESALGKSFTDLGKKISSIMEPINKTTKTVKSAVDTVKDYGKVVDEIIGGDWGNGDDRWNKLSKAGYDWAHAQNLVNEKLGDSTRHTSKYKETQDQLTKSQEKSTESTGNLSKAQADALVHILALSDAELKAKGYTDEQIKAFRELEATSKKLGIPIRELVTNLDKINGRWLLINSFKNIGSSIVKIFKAVGEAWRDAFPPMQANQLFNIIAGFHRFSTKLKMSDDTAENLTRTLKGVFAILDIILTIVGGPIKIAFKILTQILGAFDLNILDVTAIIGDAVVKFRNWLDSVLDFTAVFKKLAPYVKKATAAIKEWFAGMKDTAVVKTVAKYAKSAANSVKEWFLTLKDNGALNTFVSYAKKAGAAMKEWFAALKETKLFKLLSGYLKSSADAIAKWFAGLKEADNIPLYIIQGLVNGLKSGIKAVASIIKELAVTILDTIKGILGIHSPSTAFYDIGKNVILGLFNGIKDFITMIYDLIMSIGGKVIEIVKGFDVGSVITAFVGSGLTIGFVKIASAIEALTEPLEGVGEILKGAADVVKSFSKVLGSVGTWVKAQALKTVAISIAILVGSIALLCLLPVGKVWASIGAIAALALVLGALTFAMGKWGPKDGVQFGKMSGLLLSLAASVLILAIALKTISSIKPEAMTQTLDALWNVTKMLLLILASYALLAKKSPAVAGVGKMLFKMAAAMAIMAIVVGFLGKMKKETLIKGMAAIVTLVGVMALMMLITKIGNFKKVGTMLMQVAGAMAIMAIVVGFLGTMEKETLIKGMAAIVTLVGVMALMMLITKIGNFKKVGTMLMQVAGAMAIMAIVVGLLGTMEKETLIKGMAGIAAFVVIIAILMVAVKKFGKDAPKIAGTILAISVAIALMAGVAVLLGMVSEESLKKGVAAVTVLAILAAGLVAVTKFAGPDCYKSMIGIAIAIGVMAAAVAVLSFIDPGKLAIATIAMSVLIGMLSMLVKATGQATGSIAVLVIITVAMGMMGVILLLLAKMPIENTLGAAAGLSLLLLTMTGILYVLGKMSINAGDALIGIIGLLALCVPLVAIAGILCMMKNVNNALTNATALTLLATALTLLLLPLCAVGVIYSLSGGMAALGLLGLLGMCVPLVAIAGILCMMKNINNAMANAMALTLLITAMGDVCFKLALVGPLALIGVAALTALTALIIGVGVFAVGIGALMQKFPALQSFLDTGIPVLIQLAGGIGEMIGAFVSGIFTQIADSLPGIGLCLSQFMVNATPFIMGAKLVDESVAKGVGILVGAILALTVANFINGITNLLPFVGSFADLGTQLSQFMRNATGFIIGAKMIDPKSVESVKTLVEAILMITASNLLESITSFLTGESSMEVFGTQLKQLGTGLRGFIDALGPVSEEQVATASRAAKIIKTLAEASAAIPNTGGLLGDLIGDNDMGPWAAQLPIMASGIANFTKTLTEAKLTSESVTLADNAAKIIKTLAEAAGTIPNSGGLLADLVGDNEFSKWAGELPRIGTGIAGFIASMTLAKIDDGSVEIAKKAASIVEVLAKASEAIPNTGGHLAKLIGDNDFSKWAKGLSEVGAGVAGFANELGEFSEAKLATVKAGTEAIKVIAQMSKDYGVISDSGDFVGFGNGMVTVGKKVKAFANTLDEVKMETMNAAVEKITAVIDLSKTVAGANIESCKTFGESLKTIAKDGVKGFVDAFTTDDPKKKITDAASNLLKAFTDSAKSKENAFALKSAGTDAGKAASGGMDSKDVTTDATEAGKNVVTGFANGIKNNKSLATNAGSSLGKAALKAAKEALDENSPSKEMYKVGDFAGVGFVNALYDNVSQAYKAGTRVADSAKLGISKAVARISDIVNSDIDAQPTIRPVLDLSDVRAGAGSMNALFSGRTLSVDMAGVGSVSASMAKFQNGSDSKEIVSSIKALRKDIADMPRNSYTINGVTYDDGTNVSDAVGSLVRAIKIERRT